MFAKRSLRYVVGVIGFAMVAASADVTMRSASAQIGAAEQADIQALELAEEGARLLAVARATLAALPNNPIAVRDVVRAMRRWSAAKIKLGYVPKTKAQARLARRLARLHHQMGELYQALYPPEPPEGWPKPRAADPFPDLEPKDLPFTDPRTPDPNKRADNMGLDNPGGYVICHGAVSGALGIQRDPSRQIRQSMLKECPHLVGGAGRN